MSDEYPGRHEQIWQRLRQVILDAVYTLMGPPPPDVVQKIDDILEEAKRDWEKGTEECQDEADETP